MNRKEVKLLNQYKILVVKFSNDVGATLNKFRQFS